MKLTKVWLLLALCMSMSAFGDCTKRDLFGHWHVAISEGTEGGVICTLILNSKATVNGASTCSEFLWTSTDRTTFSLAATSLGITSSCKVTGTIGEEFDPAPADVDGQMSRDGEYIQGTLTYDTGTGDSGVQIFTAVKIK